MIEKLTIDELVASYSHVRLQRSFLRTRMSEMTKERLAQWMVDLMPRLAEADRPSMVDNYIEIDFSTLERIWFMMCNWIERNYREAVVAD